MLHSNFYRHCFLILNVANISHSYLLQVFIALKYFINIYIKDLRMVQLKDIDRELADILLDNVINNKMETYIHGHCR